jgi:hypothetical protein
MMDNPDSSALMLGAERQAGGRSSAISLQEVATVNRSPQKAGACDVASPWRNSAKLSCVWAHGIQSHAPNGRLALMKSISISTLNSEGTRNKGSGVTAALIDVPERSVTSQWSADYGARAERGDPRGRKSGVGLGTMNLT